jgi:regulatory protein
VARIAVIHAASNDRPGTASELRLIVLEDGRRFRIDAEQISRLRLQAGSTLELSVLETLESHDTYRRARETAVRLLAARPHSTAELQVRLRRAAVPVETASSVIADLAAAGYLDDLEFARAWVRSRLASHPCGVMRLRVELREKGVATALIEQAIREVDGEEDTAAAEERRAHELVARRLHAYARLAWDARLRRLAGLLERRGFAAHTIARVLRTLERRNGVGTTDA